jgi:hypothetical protein
MKGPGEKYPQEVEEGYNQKYVSAPMMDVPDELTEKNVVL